MQCLIAHPQRELHAVLLQVACDLDHVTGHCFRVGVNGDLDPLLLAFAQQEWGELFDGHFLTVINSGAIGPQVDVDQQHAVTDIFAGRSFARALWPLRVRHADQ